MIKQDINIDGWEEKKVEDICILLRGKGLSKDKINVDGKYECILYGELFTSYDHLIQKVLSRTDFEEGTSSIVEDILIPGSTTTTGIDLSKAVVINKNGVLLGGDINILRKNNDNYDSQFLAYYLTHVKKSDIGKLAKGMTIYHLYGNDIKKLHLIIPKSIREQKAIKIILFNVDKAIQHEKKIIKKIEKIKDNITSIIFHKKEFLDRIGNHIDLESGDYFKFTEFVKDGIRCLKIDNVDFGKISWNNATYLPIEYANKFNNLLLKEGDIVIALNRPIIDNKLKIAIIKNEDLPSILYQRVGRMIFKDEKILPEFLFFLSKSDYFKRELKRSLVGSDQPYIKNSSFYEIKIPILDIEEQHRIINILSTIDKKLWVEKQKMVKLEKVKNGLINEILTGKKRVNVENVLRIGEN